MSLIFVKTFLFFLNFLHKNSCKLCTVAFTFSLPMRPCSSFLFFYVIRTFDVNIQKCVSFTTKQSLLLPDRNISRRLSNTWSSSTCTYSFFSGLFFFVRPKIQNIFLSKLPVALYFLNFSINLLTIKTEIFRNMPELLDYYEF